jgi:diguanylate cyclase (GGDEF)-like protein
MAFIPLVYTTLIWVWTRPRSDWIEGSTLPLAVGAMMLAGGVLGLTGGDHTTFRYVTAALLAASTAVVILPVTLFWTVSGVATAIVSYTLIGLLDPMFRTRDTIAFALFFALVLAALIPARRTMNILQQHAFVLNLRGALRKQALASANARLAVLASTDALTGLPNRRAFEDEAARLWSDPAEPAHSFGIVLFDIDHFKRLNDTAGHAEGDRCLAAIARAIRGVLPPSAMCARYGGEEFICILREATPRDVLRFAEALRATVEALAWPNPGVGGPVTVSVGLAVGETDRRSETLAAIIELADAALYRSKAEGRNRIVPSWEPTLGEAVDRPFLPAQLCA